jgi:hypothetical protein
MGLWRRLMVDEKVVVDTNESFRGTTREAWGVR